MTKKALKIVTIDNEILLFNQNSSKNPNFSSHKDYNFLVTLIHKTQNIITLSRTVEILDFNWYKVIKKQHIVQQILKEKNRKPFVFILHNN